MRRSAAPSRGRRVGRGRFPRGRQPARRPCRGGGFAPQRARSGSSSASDGGGWLPLSQERQFPGVRVRAPAGVGGPVSVRQSPGLVAPGARADHGTALAKRSHRGSCDRTDGGATGARGDVNGSDQDSPARRDVSLLSGEPDCRKPRHRGVNAGVPSGPGPALTERGSGTQGHRDRGADRAKRPAGRATGPLQSLAPSSTACTRSTRDKSHMCFLFLCSSPHR